MGGANFRAVKKNTVGCADVERFAVQADLTEGGVGLLDQVGREGAANGLKKIRSYEPAKNHGNEQWRDEQGEKDPEQQAHVEKINAEGDEIVQRIVKMNGFQERKSTSSR